MRSLRWCWSLRGLPRFLYQKHWKYRNTIGPWMQWTPSKKTKMEILLGGWGNEKVISGTVIATMKYDLIKKDNG